MSWAGRRKGLYIGVTTFVTLVFLSGIGYLIFSHAPTCTDTIKNGTERGVDCGGSCSRICREDSKAPVILWARSFKVTSGIYTAAVYYQNNNQKAFVRGAHYSFKLFDSNNVLIAERTGVADIPPGRISAVVEANIATGNSVPARAFFNFTDESLEWRMGEAPIVEARPEPLNSDERKLVVTVTNMSSKEIDNLPIAAVLFDSSATAVGASESVIARLPKGGKETVIFTWPTPFDGIPIRAEVTALTTPE